MYDSILLYRRKYTECEKREGTRRDMNCIPSSPVSAQFVLFQTLSCLMPRVEMIASNILDVDKGRRGSFLASSGPFKGRYYVMSSSLSV